MALFSSPLERAQETARPVAERLGLEIVTDDRLIESWNHFEGMKFGVGDGSLRRPAHWPHLINPFRPSWGEPYHDVAARMLAMMETAREAAAGQEAVCVSHQLPIWVTRRMAERKRLWHNPTSRDSREVGLCHSRLRSAIRRATQMGSWWLTHTASWLRGLACGLHHGQHPGRDVLIWLAPGRPERVDQVRPVRRAAAATRRRRRTSCPRR